MKDQSKKQAVALKYPAGAAAPFISAKGQGFLAEKMLEIASQNNIPVVKDEVLENLLSIEDVGSCIPEETWNAVAAVFAYIKKVES